MPAKIRLECPECAADIVIDQPDVPAKQSGGYVLKCAHCDALFHFDVAGAGSQRADGAEIVATYTSDNKHRVLRQHGIAER